MEFEVDRGLKVIGRGGASESFGRSAVEPGTPSHTEAWARQSVEQRTKPASSSSSSSESDDAGAQAQGDIAAALKRKDYCNTGKNNLVRTCTSCTSQRTPLWRSGPLGVKTLCNACGVRWKLGKLKVLPQSALEKLFMPSSAPDEQAERLLRKRNSVVPVAPPVATAKTECGESAAAAPRRTKRTIIKCTRDMSEENSSDDIGAVKERRSVSFKGTKRRRHSDSSSALLGKAVAKTDSWRELYDSSDDVSDPKARLREACVAALLLMRLPKEAAAEGFQLSRMKCI